MAEHDGEKQEPPKIKLGLGKELGKASSTEPGTPAKSETTRLDLASARPAPAAGQPAPPKKSTSRIDLTTAVPAPPKSSTVRIDADQAQPAAPKRGTTRIDPTGAQPPKRSTTRIDPAKAAQPAAGGTVTPGKAHTSRIDLSKAMRPAEGIREEALREADVPEAAKQATQRIILEDDEAVKAETARIESQLIKAAAARPEAKKQTARIDLPDTIEEKEADMLKRRTASLPTTAPLAEPPETQPKTIRIKRPGAPPTRVLTRPGAEAAGVSAPPPAQDVMEAKKSETARLDLPPDVGERPPTRPKTIRIKRPDAPGTTRRPLTIARTEGPASLRVEPVLGGQPEALEEEEGVGAAYVVVTAAALVVAAVLIYVLSGQTYALELPFPGRL